MDSFTRIFRTRATKIYIPRHLVRIIIINLLIGNKIDEALIVYLAFGIWQLNKNVLMTWDASSTHMKVIISLWPIWIDFWIGITQIHNLSERKNLRWSWRKKWPQRRYDSTVPGLLELWHWSLFSYYSFIVWRFCMTWSILFLWIVICASILRGVNVRTGRVFFPSIGEYVCCFIVAFFEVQNFNVAPCRTANGN